MSARQPLHGQPWTLHVIDSTSQGADGVRLGDINRDNLPDITTGWEEGGLVRLYLNPGPEKAAGRWPRVTVGAVADVEDAVFADLDGDGRLEIVSSCEGDNRAMFVHRLLDDGEILDQSAWSTERVQLSAGMMQWMFCAPIDLDGSNTPVLVAGGKNDDAEIGFFTGLAQPFAWRWRPLERVGWVMTIRALDMDSDGDADILYSDRYGDNRGVRWLENPGDGELSGWRDNLIGAADEEVLFIDCADLDADGELELAAAAKPDRILLFDKTSTGWRMSELEFPDGTGRAKAVTFADLDGDSRLDMVLSCESAVDCIGVFWARVDHWPDPQQVEYFDIAGTRGIKFDRIECLDLDGDGDLDVLTTDERDNLGVIWYENPNN